MILYNSQKCEKNCYYYFRLRKTNSHHTGILRPVCNLIIHVILKSCLLYSQHGFVDMCPFTPKLLALI